MKINTWFLVLKMKIKSYYITFEYTKDYMKIKFNSDDILPLNKPLKVYQMTITIRFVKVKILKYDKIDVTEGIDLDQTNRSKKCMF